MLCVKPVRRCTHIYQSLILSCLKQRVEFSTRLTAGSDLCGREAPPPDDGGDAAPRAALAYSLLTCPLLMLSCYKNVITASWDSALSIGRRWHEESKSHCRGVTFNWTTAPVSARNAGCNGIDHWQWERSPHFDFFWGGRRCGFPANCDIDKCIILPLNIIDWVPCISLLPARRNKELERWRYSINPGRRTAVRGSGLTAEP